MKPEGVAGDEPLLELDLELLQNSIDLMDHRLRLVHTGAQAHRRRDARRTHFMYSLMTAPHGFEDIVPIALDVRAIGVQCMIESSGL